MNSEVEEEAAAVENVCANCGIAGVDNIKLEKCGGCDLVNYCSNKCKGDHREQHSEECKKRAAKLHDKRLFTQPDGTHLGECPICFLPLPLKPGKATFMACCGQTICCGCIFANTKSNIHDKVKRSRCVFCRTSSSDKEEYGKRERERIEANDPAALREMATECSVEGDHHKALKYWKIAAELGNVDAHYQLGYTYWKGRGVEKDKDKAVYYYEKAAIGGHFEARNDLACIELQDENGDTERGVKHFIIAANLGHDASMKNLLPFYKLGYITKEEYGATLRTHQAVIEAAKSQQREAAYVFLAKIAS